MITLTYYTKLNQVGIVSVVVSACPSWTLLRLRYLDPLLLPDLNLAVFRHIARPPLIVFNRLRFLPVRRRPKSMTSLRPEIKGRSVCDDLASGQTLNFVIEKKIK